LKPGRVQ